MQPSCSDERGRLWRERSIAAVLCFKECGFKALRKQETNMQSTFNFSNASGNNFQEFADAAYKFLEERGHTSVDNRILLSALGAALSHLKPDDKTFKLGACLSAFPALFQILELKVPGKATVYALARNQLVHVPRTKKFAPQPGHQLAVTQGSAGGGSCSALISQLSGRGFAAAKPSQTQQTVTGSQIARKTNVIVVLDLSGSMYGALLDQAKSAILRLWDLLQRGDSLTVITFNTTVSTAMRRSYKFEPKPGQVKRDTQFVLADLESMVSGLEAGGGTALYHALLQALDQTQAAAQADIKAHPTTPDAHTFQMFAITDGADNSSKALSIKSTAQAVNERLRNPGDWASTVHFSTCFVAIGKDAAAALEPCTTDLETALTVDNIDAGFRRVQDTIVRVRTVQSQVLKKSSFSYGRGG